jgi:hypothetical protein
VPLMCDPFGWSECAAGSTCSCNWPFFFNLFCIRCGLGVLFGLLMVCDHGCVLFKVQGPLGAFSSVPCAPCALVAVM